MIKMRGSKHRGKRILLVTLFLLLMASTARVPAMSRTDASTEQPQIEASAVSIGVTPPTEWDTLPEPPIPPPAAAPPSLWNASWGDSSNGTSGYSVAACGGKVYLAAGEDYTDLVRLLCLDNLGTQQWNITWTPDPALYMWSVSGIDADATSVYVACQFFNLTSYQPVNYLNCFAGSDGTLLWSTSISYNLLYYLEDIVVNGSRVYVAANKNPDIVIGCYNAVTGAHIWNETWTTPGSSSTVGGISVNGSLVYLASHYDWSTLVLTQYSSSGTQLWNTTWNCYGNETFAHGLAANTTGIYIGFDVYEDDYDDTTPGYTCGVVKFNSTGDEQWNTTLTHPTHEGRSDDVAVDGADVYLLSQIRHPFIDAGNVSLARFNSNGELQGEYLYKTTGEDFPRNIATDNGAIYFAGITLMPRSLPKRSSSGQYVLDSFLFRCDTTPSTVWSRHYYWQGDERTLDMAIATRGLVVVGDCLNRDQGIDQYLALLYFDGSLNWEYRWGGLTHETAYAVVVDESYIYVAGIRTTYSWTDLVLSCFTIEGDIVWVNTWHPSLYLHPDSGVDLQISQGLLYVTGTVYNLTGTNYDYDVLVARFDSYDGSLQWNTLWGSSVKEYGWSLSVKLPYVYVGASVINVGNDHNASLVCFSTSGVYSWNKTWGEKKVYEKVSVGTDSIQIYLAGSLLDYYNYPYTTVNDSFLVAYDSGGSEQWSTIWGQPNRNEITNNFFAAENTLYLTGYSADASTYWEYWESAFVAAFNAGGVHQWTVQNSGLGRANAQAGAAEEGTIFMCGVTRDDQQYNDFFMAAYGTGLIGLSDLVIQTVDDRGTPLSGAVIYSTHDGCPVGQSPVAAATNTTGHAEFNDLIPGNFTFAGTKTGYQTNETTIELTLGGSFTVNLALWRLGSIHVHVVDASGVPLNGVPVISTIQPLGQTPLGGITIKPEVYNHMVPYHQQEGNVDFFDVISGNYTLLASPTGSLPVTCEISVNPGEPVYITLVVPTLVLIHNLGPIFIGVIVGLIALVIIVFIWLVVKGRPK